MTTTRDPKVLAILGAISAGVSGVATLGVNYATDRYEPVAGVDPVLAYRIKQCEIKSAALRDDLTLLQNQVDALPPDYWRDKIKAIEEEARMQSDALIRLERHGHPELKYKQSYPD